MTAPWCQGPSWVPGGRQLLYTSWKNGGTQILEHNLATGSRRVFAGYPGANFSPEVSPDGQKVAMILSKGGSPNLYVSDLDGGRLKQLTQHPRGGFLPLLVARTAGRFASSAATGRAALQIISADGGRGAALARGRRLWEHDLARLVARWQVDRLYQRQRQLHHLRRAGRRRRRAKSGCR